MTIIAFKNTKMNSNKNNSKFKKKWRTMNKKYQLMHNKTKLKMGKNKMLNQQKRKSIVIIMKKKQDALVKQIVLFFDLLNLFFIF